MPWVSTGWNEGATGAAGYSGKGQQVGGILVRLGAVAESDYFEVRSLDDGVSTATGTRFWLFNKELSRAVFVDDGAPGDAAENDPKYRFASQGMGWSATSVGASGPSTTSGVFAIVGKDSRLTHEVFVDLVHGPQRTTVVASGWTDASCIGSASSRAFCTSDPFPIPAGSHYVSVQALNDDTNDDGVEQAFADHYLEQNPSSDTGDPVCMAVDRGRGNYLAFTMHLLRDGEVVATRHVPLAALGGRYPALNRVGLELEAPDDVVAHDYRLRIENLAVSVAPQITVVRNPSASELKVATVNLEYNPEGKLPFAQLPATLRNVADLLGGKARYGANGRIDSRANRGRWQWEADIIGVNELDLDKVSDEGTGAVRTWDMIKDRLDTVYGGDFPQPTDWRMAFGQCRRSAGCGGTSFCDSESRYSATYMRGRSSYGDGRFAPGLLDDIGCDGEDRSCWLITIEKFFFDQKWFFVPSRAKAVVYNSLTANGAGTAIKPIAVVNWYLPHEADWVYHRRQAVNTMIDKIKKLIDGAPQAFRTADLTLSGNPSYRHAGNRLIILGDSNMQNHRCGEINDTIRKLREAFGYAVDVSMAALDRDFRTFDMHYNGTPITNLKTGATFQNDCLGNSPYSGPGCPYGFRHVERWRQDASPLPRFSTDPAVQRHTWWAQTTDDGERLDVILLVGLGWTNDDPVQDYLVMSDKNPASHANGYRGGGVEFIRAFDGTPYYDVSGAGSYAPAYDASSGEANSVAGAPAVATDHRPVGVRLRVRFD